MRKKGLVDEDNGPNWLDTYADMVTLLLTFFVLLFSFSSINADKWQLLIQSLSGAGNMQSQIVIPPLPGEAVGDGLLDTKGEQAGPGISDKNAPVTPEEVKNLDDLYLYLKDYVEKNELQSDVEISKGDGFTFITFRNNIFFEGDSSVLRVEGKNVLDVITGAFVNITDQIGTMRFDGHTARAGDAAIPNSSNFDWSLSANRAVEVCWYIDQKLILESAKFSAVGHGENKPIVPHDGTEGTRIKNRRVEIYIGQKGVTPLSLDEIYAQLDAKAAGDIAATTIPAQ